MGERTSQALPELARPLSITLTNNPAKQAVRTAITAYLPTVVVREKIGTQVQREENNALRAILTGLSNSLQSPLNQFDRQRFKYSSSEDALIETMGVRVEQQGESVTIHLPTLNSQTGLQVAMETELLRITHMEAERSVTSEELSLQNELKKIFLQIVDQRGLQLSPSEYLAYGIGERISDEDLRKFAAPNEIVDRELISERIAKYLLQQREQK